MWALHRDRGIPTSIPQLRGGMEAATSQELGYQAGVSQWECSKNAVFPLLFSRGFSRCLRQGNEFIPTLTMEKPGNIPVLGVSWQRRPWWIPANQSWQKRDYPKVMKPMDYPRRRHSSTGSKGILCGEVPHCTAHPRALGWLERLQGQ